MALLLYASLALWAVPVQAHSQYRDFHQDPTFYVNRNNFSTSRFYSSQQHAGVEALSRHLALEIDAEEGHARELAAKYGLHYVSKVFENPSVYHFHRPSGRQKRSLNNSALLSALAKEPGVRWVDQQKSLVRVKRPALYDLTSRTQTHTLKSLAKVLGRRREARAREESSLLSKERDFWIQEDEDSVDRSSTRAGIAVRLPGSYARPYRGGYGGGLRSYGKRGYQGDFGYRDLDSQPLSAAESEEDAVRIQSMSGLEDLAGTGLDFNDPYFKDQWYLHNTGQLGRPGYDLNVIGAWRRGYTGRGVVLSVLDDGIQAKNADIAENYAKDISYSVIRDGRDLRDANPRLDPAFSNSHGTYCAAAIAAVSNNEVCGVGVAYDAKVGGVRLVDGSVTDIQEATALSRNVEAVGVFSASWGPTDDGTKAEGPGRLGKQAFRRGVLEGRDGKGVIYVWASGNGGLEDDNCNLDGYVSSIYTLSVSALTDTGASVFYGEPCASTLAGVFVGGEHTLEEALQKRSRNQEDIHLVVPELDGHCSSSFQGSSAAAPLMAGVVALVLQANPSLTWRDVQHLVVRAARPTREAAEEGGWETNALGRRFHLKQGYGAVDAGRLVESALTWENAGPQKRSTIKMFDGYRPIPSNDWLNVTGKLEPSNAMTEVEHVVANITLSHKQRGMLRIYIVSPSGTTSQVLTHRLQDESTSGFTHWPFMSVHFWGENPQGLWTVAIKDDSGRKGSLRKVDFVVFGTC
ncbi:LOW QUALITY PROTEIN: proprotein convertase subtilisin/kexin type 4-like [Penaeus monodon]|uniref:LOW QUALITY PROTEIN: proprotein convertase subtilisin/kexin type 4-like n=1 Tax=Penaeus monodon TaxID=6687 RepID=UPI0018A754EF|nr:LOW QUALITY PROTEIN: proprotein convertase subtilisin/kexin type 4-like [Penaeus monodon]